MRGMAAWGCMGSIHPLIHCRSVEEVSVDQSGRSGLGVLLGQQGRVQQRRTWVLLVPCAAAASRRREGQGSAQADGCRLTSPEPIHAPSSWEDLIPHHFTYPLPPSLSHNAVPDTAALLLLGGPQYLIPRPLPPSLLPQRSSRPWSQPRMRTPSGRVSLWRAAPPSVSSSPPPARSAGWWSCSGRCGETSRPP